MFYLKDHWISPSLSTVLFKHIQLQFSLRHKKKTKKKKTHSHQMIRPNPVPLKGQDKTCIEIRGGQG